MKLYCVDSLRRGVVVEPLRSRSRSAPAPRALRVVDRRAGRARHPRRPARRAGHRSRRRQPRRLPRGQLRAAARGPLPARRSCLSGNYDPSQLARLGRARRRRLLQQPDRLRRAPGRRPPRLAALAASASCSSAARASGRTRPARWRARKRLGGAARRARGSGTSSTCGGTTSRTTGRRGAPSSPIICRGSADARRPPHLIGLLLGTEEDWPHGVRDARLARSGRSRTTSGTTPPLDVERITIEPFDLRDKPRYDLVIDRLAYWYYHPREWLKKVALMDDVYLLNSPFTFQSMEKHAAYCAMMRLRAEGARRRCSCPYKNPVDNARCAYTAAKYNRPFDLDAIAEQHRLPAVHEALRRRRVARRHRASTTRPSCTAPTTSPASC